VQGRFARAQDRLHRVGSVRLADSIGSYQERGVTVADDLKLQIDQQWGEFGAGEVFAAGVKFVTWHKCCLESASSGGVFIVGNQRYLVEKIVADDGHMVTAACMVQP
jgi:hypothetical protein